MLGFLKSMSSKVWLRRTTWRGAVVSALLLSAAPALAGPYYTSGHINNVTFAGNFVMIMTDAPLPDNCVGTSFGWMQIPAANTPMIAFVLALWARGDESSTNVTVYTGGLSGAYCQVNQIDPEG